MEEDTERRKIIEEGEKAKTAVLEYADWLVTTGNGAVPDDSWSLPVPHPCSISPSNPSNISDSNADYHNLTIVCGKKPGQQSPSCRFDYPRPILSESTLTFEKLTVSEQH